MWEFFFQPWAKVGTRSNKKIKIKKKKLKNQKKPKIIEYDSS